MIMLQEFNTENLAKKIKKVSGKELHYSLFTNEVDTHIMPRIKVLSKKAKFFLFENEYIETEWKDMISVHYIN